MKRFSLRSLFIAMTVVALIMALPIHRALVQKRGRDWVATQKGRVTFSHKYNAATEQWNSRSTLLAPDWLVRALGIDLFDSVDSVVLDNSEVKDLTPIIDLQSLRYLAIIIEIDEKLDFTPLAELPKLRHLHLDYTGITAEKLKILRALLPHVRVEATNHPLPEEKR